MGSRALFRTVTLITLLLVPLAAPGETRYVDDTLVINLRDQPADRANTVEHLKTGNPFEVLEVRGDYLRVRTSGGIEGWVRAQYTTTQRPKAMVIADLEKEVAALQRRLNQTQEARATAESDVKAAQEGFLAEKGSLEARLAEVEKEAARTARELKETGDKYADLVKKSKQVIQITEERDRLAAESERLTSGLREVEDERDSLARSAAVRWFLAGAGVFLGGWIAGSVSKKRKGKYYGG